MKINTWRVWISIIRWYFFAINWDDRNYMIWINGREISGSIFYYDSSGQRGWEKLFFFFWNLEWKHSIINVTSFVIDIDSNGLYAVLSCMPNDYVWHIVYYDENNDNYDWFQISRTVKHVSWKYEQNKQNDMIRTNAIINEFYSAGILRFGWVSTMARTAGKIVLRPGCSLFIE